MPPLKSPVVACLRVSLVEDGQRQGLHDVENTHQSKRHHQNSHRRPLLKISASFPLVVVPCPPVAACSAGPADGTPHTQRLGAPLLLAAMYHLFLPHT